MAYRVRPSEEGRQLGEQLARWADQGEPDVRLTAPAHPTRCGTCAFRKGTLPNSYAETLMVALKCVIEVTPFYCHERKDEKGEEDHTRTVCVLPNFRSLERD